MKKRTWTFVILAALPVVLLFTACNPLENDSRSSSFIVVENITGTTSSGTAVNFLESDVVKVDATSGAATVYSDTAAVTLKASLLDPSSAATVSQYNDVLLDRYVVSYTRTDGKNRQGTDVPYSFEASLSRSLKIGASTTFAIIVVRDVSKLEPPLVDLVIQGRAEGVIETTAKIEFYGHDVSERTVMATGYLTVRFSNFADPAAAEAPTAGQRLY
ncbi:MAG: hypothetical protein ACYDH0_10600 [Candidatus Aminicenantales bacterium]